MSSYPYDQTGWRADSSTDVGSLHYLLSGDYYLLEQVQFHAAMGTLSTMPRGPLNTFPATSYGGIEPWMRMTAAWVTPDGTPELRYFLNATLEHVGLLEGSKGITGTFLDGTPTKTYTIATTTTPPNALWSYLNQGDNTDLRPNEGFVVNLVKSRDRKPLVYWNLALLVTAKERGFGDLSPQLLARWTDKFLGGQFREVGTYNRIFSYISVTPIVWANGSFVKSFTESNMMLQPDMLARSLTLDYKSVTYSSALTFSVFSALLVDQAPPYSMNIWKWSQRFIRSQYTDAELAGDSRLNIIPRSVPSYPAFCGAAPAPEAECIGNGTWAVLPYTGIISSTEPIRLSTVVISPGQVVTLGSSGTVYVTGNMSIGCNSTLISQGSQINVNGGSTICGTLLISKLDPSKTTLTSASCVNFTNAHFVLDVSSLSPSLTGDVTISVAQFECSDGSGLGVVGLQTSPDDCRSFALPANQPSTSRSLSVVISITPCQNQAPDSLAQFPVLPVVGGIIGGVVFVVFIVTVSVLCYKRSKFHRSSRVVRTRLRTMSRHTTD
eukprot:TRINITY_DN4281_c0_g2_i1.p1 TRINITY_DN4281_c0_g2~~TRINITY_DN4281_c0_g2_i1.p1  ORF type:complete len:551 (-),score=37.08 TRINITY_DN4281_c0_g2_i1:36-1688(-)